MSFLIIKTITVAASPSSTSASSLHPFLQPSCSRVLCSSVVHFPLLISPPCPPPPPPPPRRRRHPGAGQHWVVSQLRRRDNTNSPTLSQLKLWNASSTLGSRQDTLQKPTLPLILWMNSPSALGRLVEVKKKAGPVLETTPATKEHVQSPSDQQLSF